MRFLLLLLPFFMLLQAEQSYKKIIVGSFKKVENARMDLKKVQNQLQQDSDFSAKQTKLNLEVLIEKNGNYFSVVIKPFKLSKDVIGTIKIVRRYKSDAYIKNYIEKNPQKKLLRAVTEIPEVIEPVLAVEPQKMLETPKVAVAQKVEKVVERTPATVEQNVSEVTEKSLEKVLPSQLPQVEKSAAVETTVPVLHSKESTNGVFGILEQYALISWVISAILGLIVLMMINTNKKLRCKKEALEQEQLSSDIAIKTKDEFLAKMSHEIRTPMNAIVGFSHLLLDTKLDSDQLGSLSKIKGSADILLEIINDILDFSKLEAGMFKLEKIEFNVNTILENAANLVAVEAKKRNLEFVFDIDHSVPIKLIGDPLRVDTILINLLSNAVKFTKEGEVVLKVSTIESDDEFILDFEVKDTGIGIPEDKLPELFDSFSQADNSTTRVYGGTGLGLVITKELIELMDGEITVESQVGVGTTFKFQLHFGRPEHVDKRKYRLPSKEIMKKKVLIIDPNSTAADSLTRMIAYYQYSSDVVETMDEAFYALKILPYDIVCIDSNVIVEDVDNFINVIREKTSAKIVLLNGGIKNYQEVGGIDTELFKPFNQQDLFNAILDLYQPETRRSIHSKGITKQDLKVLSGATILLAEDNKINQSVIQSLLSDSGMNLIIANNGQEAVDVVYSDKNVDLVLMDISMPILNGYDAALKIRADEQFKDLPILALTANALSSDVKKSQEVGMQEHISKPLNVEQFYRALLKYISHRSEQDTSGVAEAIKVTQEVRKPQNMYELFAINKADGIERTGGDEVLYKEILLEFQKLYKHSSRDLEECRTMSEFDKGQKLCHDIKGVSANIGAYELSQSAKNLEYAFKSQSILDSEGVVVNYNRELEKVLIDIESFVEHG